MTDSQVATADPVPPRLRTRLTAYRVIAWVVGVFLLVLVAVAMPLKYFGDDGTLVAIVGPLHGFLYMVYFVISVDLGFRARWKPLRIAAVALAGTIPAISFVAERSVVRRMRETSAA